MSKKSVEQGIDSQTAISFWHKNEHQARLTALGIAILIGALALPIALSNGSDNLGAGLYLLGTAIGVMLIVAPRINHADHKHHRVLIATGTRQLAQQELSAYQHPRMIGMVFGIGMCIASIAPAVMLDNDFGAAIFMLFVAIGTYFLVYVNIVAHGFRRLTRKRARLV